MTGIIEEIAVDPERSASLVTVGNLAKFDPVALGPRGFRRALVEEQDIDHDVGAGLLPHGLSRQTHGSEEIGNAVDVAAGFGIALVQRITRRHEQRDAAHPEVLERFGDEEIVQ